MDHGNFIGHYAAHHCHHQGVDKDSMSRHLATEHLDDVFTHHVKPAFPAHSQVLQTRQSVHQRRRIDNPDDDVLEQKWKDSSKGFDTVDIIEWMVDTCSADELEMLLPRLTPLVLRVLDDFDVEYKTRAVILVQKMISALDVAVIARFGLDNVFIDALFKCLNYLTDARDLPLLQAAYPCLIDLIDKSKTMGSKERYVLYEKMLTDGVMPGLTYAGNKSSFLLVLLEAIDRLALELGTLLVRYLKLVLFGISSGLCSTNSTVNQVSLRALEHVIQKTSPRIPGYGGVILQGLATLWLNHCHNQDDPTSQSICTMVKKMYQLLCYVCQDRLKADSQALLDLDRPSFEALLA